MHKIHPTQSGISTFTSWPVYILLNKWNTQHPGYSPTCLVSHATMLQLQPSHIPPKPIKPPHIVQYSHSICNASYSTHYTLHTIPIKFLYFTFNLHIIGSTIFCCTEDLSQKQQVCHILIIHECTYFIPIFAIHHKRLLTTYYVQLTIYSNVPNPRIYFHYPQIKKSFYKLVLMYSISHMNY